MKKLFVGGLPTATTETTIEELFAPFGKIHSVRLVKDLFSGGCKGFGFVEMEGHEARAAITGLDGKAFENSTLKVKYEMDKGRGKRGHRR